MSMILRRLILILVPAALMSVYAIAGVGLFGNF